MSDLVLVERHLERRTALVRLNRPAQLNALNAAVMDALCAALEDLDRDDTVRVMVVTGNERAFAAGADIAEMAGASPIDMLMANRIGQWDRIRRITKPVIAAVNGWAVGGGHVLHVMCDLTIASDNARFMQTGPKVGSFDAGYGTTHLARIVGQKKAREIWFLCRDYSAEEALAMGLVNTVVPLAELERETVQWCREILQNSNLAIRMLKAAANADEDGGAGLQELAGHATMLFYMTEEGQEGKKAYLEKRPPQFDKDGYYP